MTVQEYLSGLEFDTERDIICDSKGAYCLYLWGNLRGDMTGREKIYQFVLQAINEKIEREK